MNQRTKKILVQLVPWGLVLLLGALLIMQWWTIGRLQRKSSLERLEGDARRELRLATKLNQERQRFSLLRTKDNRIVLQQRKPDGTDKDFFRGVFTSIGLGENHIFMRLPARDGEREGFHIPKLVESFVVVANGERIYRGAFVLSICSQSVALPSITLWGGQQFTIHTNLPPDSLFIGRTYAAPLSDAERDPRPTSGLDAH
jgi:hypothetical protein